MAPRRTHRARARAAPLPAPRPRNAPSACPKSNECHGCDAALAKCSSAPPLPVLAVPAAGKPGLAVRVVLGTGAGGTLLLGREADDKTDCLVAAHFKAGHMDRLRHEGTCTKCRGRMCLYLCPFAVPAVRPLRCRSCHPADGDSRLARGQCDTSGNAVAHLVGEAHCGRKHYRCGACGSTSTTRNNFLRHAAGRAHREAMGEVRWRVVSDRVVPAPREEPVEFFVDESDDASDPGWPLEGAGPTSLEAGDHLPPVLHLPCDMSLSLPDAPLVPTLAKDSADSLPSFIPAALPLPLPPLVTENPTPDLEFLRAELGDGCIRALLAAAPACDAFDEFIRMPGGEEEESVLPDAEPSGLYD